jgi:putative transcriptional regulator
MMKHHPTEALVAAYAAGTLPEAFSLVIATHISMCDGCRAAATAHESVGGALLEDCPEARVSEDSLKATLALIGGKAAGSDVRRLRPAGVFPPPLQDYVGGDLDAVKWRNVGGGVRQAILPTSKEATVRLLRIPGGEAMPEHGHRGLELTLVLQGAFRDENDRFGRGDVEVADQQDQHTPIAEPGEDCICLAATDARLRFVPWLPRLVQPFIGI